MDENGQMEAKYLKKGVWANEHAGGRNRTADTRIFSPLLYRLSCPRIVKNFFAKENEEDCGNYHNPWIMSIYIHLNI